MSRIGKKPVKVPNGVDVKIEGSAITVKGPKGSLTQNLHPDVKISLKDGNIEFSISKNTKLARSLFGTVRMLVSNMVVGVTEGFVKTLEMAGVGYRATKQGKKLVFQMGFSHPVELDPPDGIEFQTEGANKIKVLGSDRDMVGQVASDIRRIRPVEPYKAKGIKYLGEYVRRKAGKAAKTATA